MSVHKPSETAPFTSHILAEILHEAGVPKGLYNLVDGDGPTVGAAISSHKDIRMVSLTGSTGAGIDVARRAADNVKRVHQELGGKSPNVVLEDAVSSAKNKIPRFWPKPEGICASPPCARWNLRCTRPTAVHVKY